MMAKPMKTLQFNDPVFNNHSIGDNTRSAAKQSYYLPKSRTNYGIFNICFQGPKARLQFI